MMLNVNWPQLRKLYVELQESHGVGENDNIVFKCLNTDAKTGTVSAITKKVQYRHFLQVFWELCETRSQITNVIVSLENGSVLYQHRQQTTEQVPSGGCPYVIMSWSKLEPVQREAWLKICAAQIADNA